MSPFVRRGDIITYIHHVSSQEQNDKFSYKVQEVKDWRQDVFFRFTLLVGLQKSMKTKVCLKRAYIIYSS